MKKKAWKNFLPATFYQMSDGHTGGVAFVHVICHAYILSGPTVMFLAVYLN